MNYYNRHLGDYAKDTKTLNTFEHGVYTQLLDLYYTEESPITDEDAHAICRPENAKERASVQKVLAKFFVRDGEIWRHNYADRVIAKASEKADKSRENGRRSGGRPPNASLDVPHGTKPSSVNSDNPEITQQVISETQQVISSNPKITLANNQYPITNNQEKKARKRASSLPDGFGISERVKNWASEKQFTGLEAHLEHFLSYVRRNGKCYVDWDEALMGAIREDWAKLRQVNSKQNALDTESAWLNFRQCIRDGRTPTDPVIAIVARILGGIQRLGEMQSFDIEKKRAEFDRLIRENGRNAA